MSKWVKLVKAYYEDDEPSLFEMYCDALFKKDNNEDKTITFTIIQDKNDDSYYEVEFPYESKTFSSEKETLEYIKKYCEKIAQNKNWKFINLSSLFR